MSKFYKAKKFKRIQNFWYKKLRDETDYIDIENQSDNEVIYKEVFAVSDEKVEYVNLCRDFLANKNNFESDLEEFVFEKHAEGKTYRQIEEILAEQKIHPKLSKSTAERLVKKILLRLTGTPA